MFAYLTRVRAKPGKRDALIRENMKMQEVTSGEQGVPVYIFHTCDDDPEEFVYYDLYQSEEAYTTHCQSEVFNQVMSGITELADIVEVKKLNPFGSVKIEAVE